MCIQPQRPSSTLSNSLVSLLYWGTQTRHSTPDVVSKVPGKGNNHLTWPLGYILDSSVKLPLVHITARSLKILISPEKDIVDQWSLQVVCSCLVPDFLENWPLSLKEYAACSLANQSGSWSEECHRHFFPCIYMPCFFCVVCLVQDIWNESLQGLSLLVGLFDLWQSV